MASSTSNSLINSPFLDKAAMFTCVATSVEMGCRTIVDLSSRVESRDNLSANLSGTLLFGLSAA